MNDAEIRHEDVRSALRQLARDFSARQSRLIQLDCVRRSVRSAGFGISEESCSYALSCLLQEISIEELGRLRRAAGIPVAPDETALHRRPSSEAIQLDFSRSDPLLESWSAVYHLYLRPELGLDLSAFERLLGDRHRRTLQRRVARGVQALTDRLWQREHEARAHRRARALQTSLPPASGRPYLGIGKSVARLHDALLEEEEGVGLVISGPGGSGKSLLGRAIAERAVRKGSIQGLSWLSSADLPDGKADKSNSLAAAAGEALAKLARCETSLLVVDDLDQPFLSAALQRHLSQAGPNTRVLLMGRAAPVAAPAWSSWRVEPLSTRQALTLLRHEAQSLGMPDLALAEEEALLPLVGACAGLPLALLRAARALRFENPSSVARSISSTRAGSLGAGLGFELWSETWAASSPDIRRLVAAVVGLERDQQDATLARLSSQLQQPPDRTADSLKKALEGGVLFPGGDVDRRIFVSAAFLRHYVEPLVETILSAPHAPRSSDGRNEGADQPIPSMSVGPGSHSAVPSPHHGQAERNCEARGRSHPPQATPALPGTAG